MVFPSTPVASLLTLREANTSILCLEVLKIHQREDKILLFGGANGELFINSIKFSRLSIDSVFNFNRKISQEPIWRIKANQLNVKIKKI